MSTATRTVDRLRPSRETVLYALVVLNAEVLAVLLYFLFRSATLTDPRYTLYGLVWVNVGLWALWATDVPDAPATTKRRAAAVAVVYFGVLAVAGGVVTEAAAHGGTAGWNVAWLPPGWGPALLYGGSTFNLVLMPAHVVGYVALSYLVYATVVDAAGAGVAGVLGLFSCVSCSWPVLAGVAASVFGGGSALAASTASLSYDLSTLVFLATVGLLYWRPALR